MLLSKTAEYAIRCMAQIALLPPKSSLTAEGLYVLTDVPRDYLSKILRYLKKADLLHAEKGRSGGFSLRRIPSSITFLEILNAINFSFDPDHCAFGWGGCGTGRDCPLHSSFSRLKEHFLKWASKTTLADVIQTPEALSRIESLCIQDKIRIKNSSEVRGKSRTNTKSPRSKVRSA